MAEGRTCPECGATLSDTETEGLCPRCLMKLGLGVPTEKEVLASTEDVVDVPRRSRSLPDNIGSYKILELLGKGGMGEVYLAEQERPLRRRVALKVIKFGMDTEQVIARFESERQALALMSHPNIAKVLDAGEGNGRPYFVMEYVAGVPITDYCDRHRLNTAERLNLFMTVCNAVQHAHQKGIIHRDIKPSNVLVELQDGSPSPKVIDFGVAKATEQRLTEKALFTQHGFLIGTLEYMSPEQAEMTTLDVDTTTDIYSLGVLLYEMLTGVLPFDSKPLREAGYDEIRRIIREDKPPTPTTRLNSLGDTAIEVAKRRRTDLKSLRKEIRGELEWITLKALEKDRTRRYATASEFAGDIGRHIRDDPVLAGPPSRAYELRKLVRRHKVGFAFACSLAILITVFAVTATIQAQRISNERDRAQIEAQRVNLEAEGIYRLIQTDGEEGFDLLREAMDLHRSVLGSDSPELAPHLYKLAAVMDLGAAEANRPEITGLFREALSILRQTVPQEDPRILESIHFLADNLFVPRPPPPPPPAGGLVERKSYASGNQGREYAPDLILEEKEGLYREALELTTRLFPGDESRSASVLGDLATVLERRGDEAASNGDYRSAELFYREAVELTRRADSPLWRIVAAEGNLVDALAMSGSYTEAEDLLLSGYARLEQSDERQAPRRRTSTLERLIALYEVWGRLDIAAEYATRLATLSPP